jgi:hypothetical protein
MRSARLLWARGAGLALTFWVPEAPRVKAELEIFDFLIHIGLVPKKFKRRAIF